MLCRECYQKRLGSSKRKLLKNNGLGDQENIIVELGSRVLRGASATSVGHTQQAAGKSDLG
jgi:hypothetical protein